MWPKIGFAWQLLLKVTHLKFFNNPPSALDADARLRTGITFDKFCARTVDMKLYYQSDGSRTVGNNFHLFKYLEIRKTYEKRCIEHKTFHFSPHLPLETFFFFWSKWTFRALHASQVRDALVSICTSSCEVSDFHRNSSRFATFDWSPVPKFKRNLTNSLDTDARAQLDRHNLLEALFFTWSGTPSNV